MEIMEGLRGHLSGLGIPTYVVDSPHGGGKIPVMPNYVISASDDAVVLRNYEGMLVRYQAEDKPNTAQPTTTRGVSALLQGSQTALMPENSERMARRRQRHALPLVTEGDLTGPEERLHQEADSCCGESASPPTLPQEGLYPLNVLANG
jgi:hypothetical protein